MVVSTDPNGDEKKGDDHNVKRLFIVVHSELLQVDKEIDYLFSKSHWAMAFATVKITAS